MFILMETLARFFKGLSDVTRLRILNLLRDSQLCVCDLMAVLDMPQSTISRHLAYLKKTGWIESQRKGKWTYHRRTPHPTPLIADAFALLDDEFANTPAASEDAMSLEKHLLAKTENACA